MILEIPEAIADHCECDEAELLFGLTLGLYLQGRLTGGQAGAALGVLRAAFLGALHDRSIALPYEAEEAAWDLEAIEHLWPRKTGSGESVRWREDFDAFLAAVPDAELMETDRLE